jgi:hypothetical protein
MKLGLGTRAHKDGIASLYMAKHLRRYSRALEFQRS